MPWKRGKAQVRWAGAMLQAQHGLWGDWKLIWLNSYSCVLLLWVASFSRLQKYKISTLVCFLFVFLKILVAYILFSEFTNFTHLYYGSSDMFLSNPNFLSDQFISTTSVTCLPDLMPFMTHFWLVLVFLFYNAFYNKMPERMVYIFYYDSAVLSLYSSQSYIFFARSNC